MSWQFTVGFESQIRGSKFSADLHEANAPLVRCYAPWGSLLAHKFSLFWRLGNSVRKQLNFLPKAGTPRSSRARNRRISLYFPVEQGIHGDRGRFASDCQHSHLVGGFQALS